MNIHSLRNHSKFTDDEAVPKQPRYISSSLSVSAKIVALSRKERA